MEEECKVPSFQVEHSNKKWGNMKVEVLRINCAECDAQYLKFLFSTASSQGQIKKGIFVPTRIYLMESKEVLTSILQDQIKYLKETVGIPIIGITKEAIKIPNKAKQTKIMDFIKHNMINLYRNYNGQSRIIRVGTTEEKTDKNTATNNKVLTYAAALTNRFTKSREAQTQPQNNGFQNSGLQEQTVKRGADKAKSKTRKSINAQ